MIGFDMTLLALLMVAGVALDWLLGEVSRWHPLVGFGRYVQWLEGRLNRQPGSYARGALAWLLAVLPLVALSVLITILLARQSFWLAAAWHVVLLYFCIGLRSLRDHVMPIAKALKSGDLAAARNLTGRIVSRDTTQSQETDLAKAAVESLLENGNDAVFGTLFWFALGGGPGALLFRLANTLDAMWGYRTPRFLAFGCVAARIDDGLNWIPARLTAWSYALLGNWRQARTCWRTQAPAWSSPNAGPVMSSGAGALGLSLGGAAIYDGEVEERPPLGVGRDAVADDIVRAWKLVSRTAMLWLTVMLTISMLMTMFYTTYVSLTMGGTHA
ncbi:cobalamin biosynthesis protein [Herbaspirillum sp. meg3]|uniref:adenosylcobinamide-phosphate synthase CbiB n=1 Tax=Herbaspirillum sp. meg3 TaxID=2025949 RepID=UPI000B9935BB|nr:adenosylcobinamide-phosphate synthase CbiB [Herbaspirillum sp. meg3]ASU39001.1 cobalamin biosynthesis protein [Herbaspirillum sp. meg3]